MLIFVTNHDEPCDEGRVSDISEFIVVDVCLHLQVEQETLIDDVRNPATATSGQKKICLVSRVRIQTRLHLTQKTKCHHMTVQLIRSSNYAELTLVHLLGL